ncbi:MAG: hypothetical protein M1334_03425 [Patescibacteria group bacterium]|nr:hypothetical protein [Patescibacteria group bacterium]
MKKASLIILAIIILTGIIVGVKFTSAAIGTPFGGRIVTLTACNLGYVISVGQPKPVIQLLVLFADYGTLIREQYMVLPGVAVMGFYYPYGGTCPLVHTAGVPYSAVLGLMGTSLR